MKRIEVTANAKMRCLDLTIDGEQWVNLTAEEARRLRLDLQYGLEDLERARCHPAEEEKNV